MTDAPILTPASIRASLSLASEVVGMHAILDSHEALRTQLADTLNRAVVAEQRVLEADADRADILARRDQVLDDLRQSLEAEIAARKLVEAKLTVAEAERDEARAALSQWPHAVERAATADAHEECARANRAEAALARVRDYLKEIVMAYDAYRARGVLPAMECYQRMVIAITDARATLTPAAPETQP